MKFGLNLYEILTTVHACQRWHGTVVAATGNANKRRTMKVKRIGDKKKVG